MRWLFLVLLFAAQARAQDANSVPIRATPTPDCIGCSWHDPYVYELASLRARRPSYFWPTALIVVGSAAMAGSLFLLGDEQELGRRTAITLSVPAVLGAGALTAGIAWRLRRTREREPFDRRIEELESARAELPYDVARVEQRTALDDSLAALRRARPSLALPIALTSVGLAMIGVGAFFALAGVATGTQPATIAGEVLAATGVVVTPCAGAWWRHRRSSQRPYNEQLRELKRRRALLSWAPLQIRW